MKDNMLELIGRTTSLCFLRTEAAFTVSYDYLYVRIYNKIYE